MARTKNPLPSANVQNPRECPTCHTVLARKGDMTRHMRIHTEKKLKTALSYRCPWRGCLFSNLQKSNVDTHLRTHTKNQRHRCPEDDCNFKTCDPGSLTRHRKRRHQYVPKPRRRRATVPVPSGDAPPTAGSSSSSSTEERNSPESEDQDDDMDSVASVSASTSTVTTVYTIRTGESDF
ncbi:hypothetical protein BT96DRAFT_921227 [Gymnopus androsaceus JB14]|uniref:C2H2-type domain-containing protein n=1 Tax=Gymnopus androsaceus JB14 TaxID=1447944 RepID=A0A6A4HL21_9AGAR|nr:hypothetical protein BT96DRAFT_921227 [Gymnopus androsaceus JB14]